MRRQKEREEVINTRIVGRSDYDALNLNPKDEMLLLGLRVNPDAENERFLK